MRLPDFLIIGAMKSGTTSLYRDLLEVPGVFLPIDKEPNSLLSGVVETADGRAAYARLFARVGVDQVCGEASTAYSKVPDHLGVPERARRVLGGETRILYLVREPVARTVSQHFHELAAGDLSSPIDVAVHDTPRLVDYSLYWMQLQPWLDAFGPSRIQVVPFERYVANRRAEVERIAQFLGVEGPGTDLELGAVHNRSVGKPVPRGPLWRLSRSALYRKTLRPYLSSAVKGRLRSLLLSRTRDRPAPPKEETVEYLLERVAGDAEHLRIFLGAEQPLWDWAAVRRQARRRLEAQPVESQP